MSYLAKIKADPRVEEVFSEDGNIDPDREDWWVHLKSGFCSDPELHSIHEQTLEECWKQLKLVSPCACKDCRGAKP